MRSLLICTAHPILCGVGDKIEKNEMGGACSAYLGGGEVCTGFWWGNLRERDHLENLGVDGRVILKWIIKKCVCGCGLD